MKILFLFYTQAELGAPGYLSRQGEEAATHLATTLCEFLQNSLGIDLNIGFNERAKSIAEDLRWRAFKQQASLPHAINSALQLYHDVLLLCGNKARTLRTTEPISQQMALPVCVDERIDSESTDKLAAENLDVTLLDFFNKWLQTPPQIPRLVIVGTSKQALEEWLKNKTTETKFGELQTRLNSSSFQDKSPTVFVCGAEKNEVNEIVWSID